MTRLFARTIVIHLRGMLGDPRKGSNEGTRGRSAFPGKKSSPVSRRGRDTHRAANARERNSHYFSPDNVYNPAARVFLFSSASCSHPARPRLHSFVVVLLSSVSPLQKRYGEGGAMHACAGAILSISLFRAVVTGRRLRCRALPLH